MITSARPVLNSAGVRALAADPASSTAFFDVTINKFVPPTTPTPTPTPTPAPTSSGSGSAPLASTGSDLGVLIALALSCLGLGLLLNRRRASGTHRAQ
jgi:hypothetical protein